MKLVLNIFGWALLIYVAFVGGLFFAQRDMMYFPSYDKPAVKASGIIGMEEITVKTTDGLDLFGWYKPPSIPEKPVILWFHGNASNVAWTSARAQPYLKEGYGVLLAEYRGYASNPGKPSENGFYNDGRAYIDWLIGKGFSENKIIVYGESIGSGVAVQMATEYPKIHTLILEAPFTSAIDVAKSNYPFIPVGAMMKDRYDNLSKIKSIRAPLIVIHGEQDAVVPYAFGERLFQEAPEPKSMITIQEGGHNNLGDYDVSGKILSSLSE